MRKNHVPPEVDAIYERMMNNLNERDADFLNTLDEKLEVARKEDWPKQAFDLKRGQVEKIEEKIGADRAKADKFFTMKWE